MFLKSLHFPSLVDINCYSFRRYWRFKWDLGFHGFCQNLNFQNVFFLGMKPNDCAVNRWNRIKECFSLFMFISPWHLPFLVNQLRAPFGISFFRVSPTPSHAIHLFFLWSANLRILKLDILTITFANFYRDYFVIHLYMCISFCILYSICKYSLFSFHRFNSQIAFSFIFIRLSLRHVISPWLWQARVLFPISSLFCHRLCILLYFVET